MHMTTAQITTTDPSTLQNLDEYAKRLGRWINRVDRWRRLCADMTAAERDHGRDSAEWRAAYTAWRKGSNPSKASTGHAYDRGTALARALGRTDRLESMDQLRDVLREWKLAR